MSQLVRSFPKILVLLLFLMYAGSVQAYIGPGLGAGAIAAVLGVLGSIFVGIFAVVYYPIKRKMRKKKLEEANKKQKSDDEDDIQK